MDKKHDLKACPFCGCTTIHVRPTLLEGSWVTRVECGGNCFAQMMCDTQKEAIERWNARAYDPLVRQTYAHMKQMEWERDQALESFERMKSMSKESVKLFLQSHRGIYSAKHGVDFVYIGRDLAERWWMEWNGECECLDCGDGEKDLAGAKLEAHRRIDEGRQCTGNLQWAEVD